MKHFIKILLTGLGLAFTVRVQAQMSFSVQSETGSTNTQKCGFQECTNECPPLVKYYTTQNYTESKDVTETGSDWYGNFSL